MTSKDSLNKVYDLFISHKSEYKPWVETLATNLTRQGYQVFLDSWELVPGKSIIQGLYQGLQQSRKGILVVTPEALDSGWVREEYDAMMVRKQADPGFRIIPVLLGKDIPDFPFLRSVLCVDFREPQDYRKAFYRLLCAIEDTPPGPDIHLDAELLPPPPLAEDRDQQPQQNEISFVEELFELLYNRQAVLLLAQADQMQASMKSYVLAQAEQRYGQAQVLHLVPPYSPQTNLEEYFSILGAQCGFPAPTPSSLALMAAFEDRMHERDRLFLLVSGFENSCKEGRKELSGMLRSLNERHPTELRILLCGGEKLAGLYYTGTLSFLNQAEAREWPEMTLADVQRMQAQYCRKQNLDQDTARMVLEVSGGHPRLVQHCFSVCQQNSGISAADCCQQLKNLPFVWQLFTPFLNDTTKRTQLCQWLRQQDLGPAQPYLFDALKRRLYWKNILKRTLQRRLVWRCELLREVGQQILGTERE